MTDMGSLLLLKRFSLIFVASRNDMAVIFFIATLNLSIAELFGLCIVCIPAAILLKYVLLHLNPCLLVWDLFLYFAFTHGK